MNKKVIIIAIAIVAALIAWFVYRSTLFRVIATTPQNNAADVSLDTKVVFEFSKDLAANQEITATITPEQPLDTIIEGRTITVITGLLPNSRYTISLRGITAIDGAKRDASTTFSTSGVSAEVLKRKQALLRQLPHTTENFSVDYIANSNLYVVDIYKEPVDQIKKQALAFLADYYVTESTDNIEFYVIPAVSGNSGP